MSEPLLPPEEPFTTLRIIRWDPEDDLPNIPETFNGIGTALKKGHDLFMVAVGEEEHIQPVGYFTIEERTTPQRWDWRLSYLHILTPHRRDGIATEVLRVIKDKFGIVTASVPEDNLPAQLLLKKSGFKCSRSVSSGEGEMRKTWYVFNFPPLGREEGSS